MEETQESTYFLTLHDDIMYKTQLGTRIICGKHSAKALHSINGFNVYHNKDGT